MKGVVYFVANDGNDSNAGTSIASAWKTIAKVNASSFNAGDVILFNKGDTWYETLIVPSSGSLGLPITFGAYGSGINPVISGFQEITSWTSMGGGIYYNDISPQSSPDLLLINGVNTAKGRWPNTTWRTNTAFSGTTQLTDPGLITTNVVGATVVIRVAECLIDRSTITGKSGTTLTYNNITEQPDNGNGYFIQNHISLLDVLGEWCYFNGILYCYFGSNNPADYSVKVSVRSRNILINNKNYIKIENLYLTGSNDNAIDIITSDYLTITNCDIKYNGSTGIRGGANCDHVSIYSNVITDSNDMGIYMNACTYVTVQSNEVKYSGYLLGMGHSGYDSYSGVINWGHYSITTYNKIEYSGYCGIKFGGQDASITYNIVTHSCLHKDDGAAMYTFRCAGAYDEGVVGCETNKVIAHNIILYVHGQTASTADKNPDRSAGIYFDGAGETTVEYNVIAHCEGGGVFANSSKNITIRNNLLFDNNSGVLALSQSPEDQRGLDVKNNILFAKYQSTTYASKQLGLKLIAISPLTSSAFPTFGEIDSNWYAKPINNANYILTEDLAWGGGTLTMYELEEFQATGFGFDANSQYSSVGISDTSELNFIYNATNLTKTYTLSSPMRDVKNNLYPGTFSLSPYHGEVLIGTGAIVETGGDFLPTVITNPITLITNTTAVSGGNITSDGGLAVTARGVCWSTSTGPTTADDKTEDGTGTGSFTSNVTGLTNGETYYLRAYATNSIGTAYGSERVFTTPIPTSPGVRFIMHDGVFVIHNGKFIKSE